MFRFFSNECPPPRKKNTDVARVLGRFRNLFYHLERNERSLIEIFRTKVLKMACGYKQHIPSPEFLQLASSLRILPSPRGRGDRRVAFTLAEVFSPHYKGQRKAAFTLAEVLITLGIIGVVAAITMPSLIANYQKKVYYNQFMKAVNVLENAVKRYEYDNGCEGNIRNCISGYNAAFKPNFVDDFSKYFNISQLINEDNASSVCAGYYKLPVASKLDGSGRDGYYSNLCIADLPVEGSLGFITTDGILFAFGLDAGSGNGSVVDINGPDKGPNTEGRDIFTFYMIDYAGIQKDIVWGGERAFEECNSTDPVGCAAKLLSEGKMNY